MSADSYWQTRTQQLRGLMKLLNPYRPEVREGLYLLNDSAAADRDTIVAQALKSSGTAHQASDQVMQRFDALGQQEAARLEKYADSFALDQANQYETLAAEYADYYAKRPTTRRLAGMIYGKEQYQLTGEKFEFTVSAFSISLPHSFIAFKDIGYKPLVGHPAIWGLGRVLGNLILTQLKADNPGANVEMKESLGFYESKITYQIFHLKKTQTLHDL